MKRTGGFSARSAFRVVDSPGDRPARKPRTRSRSSYARRERAFPYMGWVKTLPCLLTYAGGCQGVIEADHAGDRGVGRKAPDRTCIPLCTRHHWERTNMKGYFASFDAPRMREWRHMAIANVHAVAIHAGVAIPDC